MEKNKYTPQYYTVSQIAYLAGIIDAKGNIFVTKDTTKDKSKKIGHFRTSMRVDTVNKQVVDWLYLKFGGRKGQSVPKKNQKTFKNTVYNWSCTGERLNHLCELILPYLVIKKELVSLLLDMRKTNCVSRLKKGGKFTRSLSDETIQRRIEIMNQFKKLKYCNHSLNN